MRRKISWTDGRTDRGKTQYTPPPSGSGGITTGFVFEEILIARKIHINELLTGYKGKGCHAS